MNTTTTTRYLGEIIDRFAADFAWMRRNGLFVTPDWDMATPWDVVTEEGGTGVYVSRDGSVIEINSQGEPNIVAADPTYAQMVREREAR